MNVLNSDKLSHVSGGMIGGGYTKSGMPLLYASATHEPGQNSWGESVLGGEAAYYNALEMGGAQIAADAAVAQQIGACAQGGLACLIATINAIKAIDATVVPTPHIKK